MAEWYDLKPLLPSSFFFLLSSLLFFFLNSQTKSRYTSRSDQETSSELILSVSLPLSFLPSFSADVSRFSDDEQISLGDMRSYFLSTAKNELGVLFAKSVAGMHYIKLKASYGEDYDPMTMMTDDGKRSVSYRRYYDSVELGRDAVSQNEDERVQKGSKDDVVCIDDLHNGHRRTSCTVTPHAYQTKRMDLPLTTVWGCKRSRFWFLSMTYMGSTTSIYYTTTIISSF